MVQKEQSSVACAGGILADDQVNSVCIVIHQVTYLKLEVARCTGWVNLLTGQNMEVDVCERERKRNEGKCVCVCVRERERERSF